jgi:penicillin-binding protein 2
VVLGVLVVSLVATLLGRLWYLQVLAAPTYRADAFDNQIRDIVTEAPRGEIVDDKGRPFVDNKTAFVVTVSHNTLEALPDSGQAVLERLSRVLHLPYGEIRRKSTPCMYKTVTDKAGKSVEEGLPKGCWNGAPSQPIPVSQVKPDLTSTQRALEIQDTPEKFPGVSAQLTAVRHYPMPDGALASSILGYVRKISPAELKALPPRKRAIERNTLVGATGIEAGYNQYLHGREGVRQITVDHVGTQTGTVKNTPPRAGDDIVTNIDAKAQAALEHQLRAAIVAARVAGKTADYDAGVVLNVRTGGVIAMGSEPTYKPNHAPPTLTPQQYTQESHHRADPFIDKSYESSNPPGSTFKLISASGLLADGTAVPGDEYDCSASFGGKTNFEGEVGGEETLHTAIVQSCDTVFYRLAESDWSRDDALVKAGKKPVEGVQAMAHAYGIADSSEHLDIPGATVGHIGDRLNTKLFWQENAHKGLDYCKGAQNPTFTAQHRLDDQEFCQTGYLFEPGDQENEDIGQGTVLVSPLQLAVAYAALANGGTVYEPRVVKAITTPSGKLIKRIPPTVRDHLPISATDLDYIRQALYGVTTETGGTAVGAFTGFPMNQVKVGGKTGTAELTGTSQDGSWFASFAGRPGAAPQYVTVIEVHKANQGAESSAPFVRNMWDKIYGLEGSKAIFKNGVPPSNLPLVGAAAAQAKLARQQAHRAHRRNHAARHHSANGKTSSGGVGGTPSSPPPSSPSTNAGGIPPGLAVLRRGGPP